MFHLVSLCIQHDLMEGLSILRKSILVLNAAFGVWHFCDSLIDIISIFFSAQKCQRNRHASKQTG